MPYKDADKRRASNAKSQKKRNNLTYERRRDLLSEFPCHCCGDPDNTVIQWHHVEPENKEFALTSGAHSEERWWNEVLKCIPVCANCHVKLHKNTLCLIPQRL